MDILASLKGADCRIEVMALANGKATIYDVYTQKNNINLRKTLYTKKRSLEASFFLRGAYGTRTRDLLRDRQAF